MAGGGELAAIFQARRESIKKVEEETCPASGELAAVFQARKIVEAGGTVSSPRPLAAPMSPSSVVGPSTPKPNGVTSKFTLPSLIPSPTPPDTCASATRNEVLTAKFESRDLEAGIPTPGFLQDVRKNLKKPGEKRVVANPPLSPTTAASPSAAEYKGKVLVQEQRDEGEGLESSSSTKTPSRDQVHQDLMSARRSRMVASRSVKSMAVSDNCIGFESPLNKLSNNSKMLLSINSSASSTVTPTLHPKSAPTTPASARREKLRARVRASHLRSTSSCSQDNLVTDFSDEMSVGKIYISSPSRDEIELSFFDVVNHARPIPTLDDADKFQQNQNLMKQTHQVELQTDSVDSIYKDLHTTSTGSTLKTANNSSCLSGIEDTIFRDRHNASTPKICGSQHSRYNEEQANEEKNAMVDSIIRARNGGIRREFSTASSTDQYNNLSQPYAVTRSPSQGSQMSAITTPSCFPQDNITFPAFGGGHSAKNNNWTHETPIFEVESFGNSASGSASKSFNDETIYLCEQVKELKKKLEEKDAIISQLVKRISDLEKGNSFGVGKVAPGGVYQQQPPPRSYSTDDSASAFSTPNPVSLSPRVSNNTKGRQTGGCSNKTTRNSFNISSGQSVHSVRSTTPTDRKFAC